MKGPFSVLLSAGLVEDLPDYTGPIADGYDAIEGRRVEDIPFYQRLLKEPGHVIDLGCGTGRITEVLLDLGHRVTAIDNSVDMLAKLRDRLSERENLQVQQGSMDDFTVNAPVDSVVISYNSFYNMHTPDMRVACYQSCHRALKPDGQLIIDVDLRPHPNLQSGFYAQVVPQDDGRMNLYVDFADLNQPTGMRQTQYLCLTLEPNGKYTGTLTETTDHIPSPSDIKDVLGQTGFAIEGFFGDYDGTRLKDCKEKTKLIAVARRL